MFIVKVLSKSEKVLFERMMYPNDSLEVPFSTLVAALDYLYQGVPHTIHFITEQVKR